jgi:type VI protein secretion system component VasK
MNLIAGIGFAVLFYAIAEYEHLTGWKWAAASLVITSVILQLTGWMLLVLPAQAVLFGVLWWKNAQKQDSYEADRAAGLEEDRRRRQEAVRRAHEQADRGGPARP